MDTASAHLDSGLRSGFAERWTMVLDHRDEAVARLTRATGQTIDSEDCVNDAMIRVVQRDDLDPSRIRAALVAATLRVALSNRRRAERFAASMPRLIVDWENRQVSPEDLMVVRAETVLVRRALEALPARERDVLSLRIFGLTVGETAALLEVVPKTVEGTYTRARRRVAVALRSWHRPGSSPLP